MCPGWHWDISLHDCNRRTGMKLEDYKVLHQMIHGLMGDQYVYCGGTIEKPCLMYNGHELSYVSEAEKQVLQDCLERAGV